jgi:hypothetical protein
VKTNRAPVPWFLAISISTHFGTALTKAFYTLEAICAPTHNKTKTKTTGRIPWIVARAFLA